MNNIIIQLNGIIRKIPFKIRFVILFLAMWLCFVIFTITSSFLVHMELVLKRNPIISPAFKHLFYARSDDVNLCSTNWINGSTIQFIAFSVKNFSEVNIMMPAEFSGFSEGEYSCLFHQPVSHISMPVKKLGGSRTLDASRRTLHLRCAIPHEIKNSDRPSVMMTLGKFLFTYVHNYIAQNFKTLEMVKLIQLVFVELIDSLLMVKIIRTIVWIKNLTFKSKLKSSPQLLHIAP